MDLCEAPASTDLVQWPTVVESFELVENHHGNDIFTVSLSDLAAVLATRWADEELTLP